jgi:hypothetical protein
MSYCQNQILWWPYITFLFQLSFQMQIFETRVVGDHGINWTTNLPDYSPLLNSFQQYISYVICFLILRTILWFKEWNLERPLDYIDFNFITTFHFQYPTLDPINFGYSNISTNFSMCVKSTLSLSNSIFHPFHYLSTYQVDLDLPFSPLLIL